MAARDRDGRYSAVTKTIHWTMAVLLFWQFGGTLTRMTR